jgi:hypothetical protein
MEEEESEAVKERWKKEIWEGGKEGEGGGSGKEGNWRKQEWQDRDSGESSETSAAGNGGGKRAFHVNWCKLVGRPLPVRWSGREHLRLAHETLA